jgi:hypothetical protein
MTDCTKWLFYIALLIKFKKEITQRHNEAKEITLITPKRPNLRGCPRAIAPLREKLIAVKLIMLLRVQFVIHPGEAVAFLVLKNP